VAAIARATGTAMEDLMEMAAPAKGSKKTSRSGVRFVYFDLNGTLVRSYEKALTKVATEAGLPVDTVEKYYWRYDDEVCNGRMSMNDFNAAMGEHLGLSDFDWPSHYLEAVEPVEGMSELVEWVSQNYEVGLLSGTMPGLIQGLADRGKIPLDKFSKVIDSSVVKLLKYGPEIFEYAQAEAGCEPHSILLVDDDKVSIINADRLQWQICRFDAYDPAASIARVKAHLEF